MLLINFMQITPSSLMAGTMVAVRIHIVLVQIEWVWSTQPQNHSKGSPYLAVIRVGHFEMQPWLYFKLLPAERTIIDRYDNYLCKMVDSNHSNNQPNDTTTKHSNSIISCRNKTIWFVERSTIGHFQLNKSISHHIPL